MTGPTTITKMQQVSPEQTNHLSVQSINVCGLKGKLKIPEFRDNLKCYDISLLSETKLDNADTELI